MAKFLEHVSHLNILFVSCDPLDEIELLNRIGNDTHKHTVFILHVSNESEAYFVALLASKSREKHTLTYRPFNFLNHPPNAS